MAVMSTSETAAHAAVAGSVAAGEGVHDGGGGGGQDPARQVVGGVVAAASSSNAGGKGDKVGGSDAPGAKRAAEGEVEGHSGGGGGRGEGGGSKRAKAMNIAGTDRRRVIKLKGLSGLYVDMLDSQLKKWALPFCNLSKKKHEDVAQLELPDDKAILMGSLRVIDNQSIKGKVIKIAYEDGDDLADVRPPVAVDENEETARGLVRQVAPLFDMEYEDQLSFKKCLLMASLKKVTQAMAKEMGGKGVELPKWVWKAHQGPCLDIGKVHPSPTIKGYRNKNEFTIGVGCDGKPQVGFRFGKFVEGRTGVGCADDCPNIPESALAVARCMREFIVDHQDMEPWGCENHTGFWRMLLVRTSRSGDVMVMVQYSRKNAEKAKSDDLLERMKKFLLEQVQAGKMTMSSLFVQEHDGVSNKAADDCPLVHLWGETCFYESLLSLRFRISPTAFFQVNTLAAETLNGLIRDWAAAEKDQVVLDVCCGTGTIGLCIASRGPPPHVPAPRTADEDHVDDNNEIFATLECSMTTFYHQDH